MNQKIIISPLNEIISNSEQNFLNDKCNLTLNDGNPLLIDLNHHIQKIQILYIIVIFPLMK